MVILMIAFTTIFTAMIYGPMAAMLVELFPARIRYTSLSLPYHIGNGWFGGLLPTTAFMIVAATGDIFAGLWYPVIIAGFTFVVALFFLPETYKRKIHHSERMAQRKAAPSELEVLILRCRSPAGFARVRSEVPARETFERIGDGRVDRGGAAANKPEGLLIALGMPIGADAWRDCPAA